ALAGGPDPGAGRGSRRAGRPVAPGPPRRPARGGAGRRRRGWHVRPRDRPRAGRPPGRRAAGRAAALGAPRAPGPRSVAGGRLHPHRGRRGARRGDGRRRRVRDRGGGVMRAWAIFRKELRVYFSSPIAYAVLTIFSLITGWFFYNVFGFYVLASMQAAMNPMMARDLSVVEGVLRPLFQNVSVIMLLMMPILTMRLFSEEKKSGTIELLLTYPVRDGEVLLGKYLAALAVFAAMLVLTLAYPLIMAWVTPLEWGPLATGYLGLLLQGAAFIAIGILISSLTENQIVAAVATFGTLLIFWVIAWASDSAGGTLGRVLSHLSLTEHFDSFSKGVIDTKDLIYYANLTILALFLTLRSLDSKRW